MNVHLEKWLHIRCLHMLLLTVACAVLPLAGLSAKSEPAHPMIQGRQVMLEKLRLGKVPVKKPVAEIVVEIEAELVAEAHPGEENLQRKRGVALYRAAEKLRRDQRFEDAVLLAGECERAYEKVIDLNLEKGELPDADDLCALGRLYEFILKDLKGAARFYREALAVDPEHAFSKTRYQRIWSYTK